ncbi:olfactory receptor 5AR1-like [Rhinoderma darwinii]|uniref:olfactory receptor 5AR1-like n=1 Tax=Rhinoderma darwinii TaxID=43563 RepID=UPI003F678F76
MDHANISVVKYFIISGISDVPMIHFIIFLLVLLIYLLTLGGNLSILLVVCLDQQLHTPMYFFLCNLSILDITCSTNNLNNVLISFVSGDNTVSFLGCIVQIFIFLSLTCSELLILAAMSYDRYVAICNPLRYHMIMNCRICGLLAIVCWVMGTVESIPIFWELLKFSCYKSNRVNHFFCDIMPVLKLSCSDTHFLDLYILTVGVIISAFSPFLMTFVSYVFIIATILKIRSTTGRRKAFYTCSSHLTVVFLLYTTLAIQYMRPHSLVNLDSNKLISLFNTAALPILNPLIYSLKNKDVKAAFRRRMRLSLLPHRKDSKLFRGV